MRDRRRRGVAGWIRRLQLGSSIAKGIFIANMLGAGIFGIVKEMKEGRAEANRRACYS